MGRQCEICGKGTVSGYSVSHSHIRSKRTFRANLQRVKGQVDGRVQRLRVCAACLKAGRVRRVG